MAVPPKFAGHQVELAPAPSPPRNVAHTTHTLELYADYCCPFSGRMFRTLTETVIPAIRGNPERAAKLTVIFRQQVQPWHPSSTLMHESALAVLRLAPSRFWEYSAALFAHQTEFFDVSVVEETRMQTYRRLAKIAANSVGVKEDEVLALLKVPDRVGEDGALNVGNAVTDDVKLVTKMNRLTGVHVTPTVVFDGVVQDVGSSWTGGEWDEWLAKVLA